MAKLDISTPLANLKEPFPQDIITNEPTNVDLESNSYHVKNKNDNPDLNPDFKTIKLISTIVMFFLRKGWMMSSTCIFITFIAYWCYGSLLALLLFVSGLAGLFYQVSDWLLYHPDEPPHSRLYVPMPSLVGLPSDSLFLTTEDGVKIHAFFLKQEPSIVGRVPTLMFLHGNAGNVGHRLPVVQGFYNICRFNILLLEYRGYGRSEGQPSEEGLYTDAQAGLKFLLQVPFIDKSKIVVYGCSLGGAVAIDLVSRPEYGKCIFVLIVENTFTSIPEVALGLFNFRFLNWMPLWAYKNRFESVLKTKRICRPTLFISGEQDALIPPEMMKTLHDSCGSPIKRLHLFPMGTHNDTWKCQGYYTTIDMFIDDIMLLIEHKM